MTTRRDRATARSIREDGIDLLIARAERGVLTRSEAAHLRQLIAESRRIASETARSLGGVQSRNQHLTARAETAEATVRRLLDLADYWRTTIGGQPGQCVHAAITAVADGTHPPLPGATEWAWSAKKRRDGDSERPERAAANSESPEEVNGPQAATQSRARQEQPATRT
ncbi:hypothetical protein GCM10010406_21440 [Streptomyces thermolineatus]|uniref:Mobilization protein n=1 Tax=Streptomyces thermolineatus TaxID=44033 RepID=A0ABP5YPP4_9ACTN